MTSSTADRAAAGWPSSAPPSPWSRRLTTSGALVAAALLAFPGAAGASTDRTISLSPARAEGELVKGVAVGPFTIANTTRRDYELAVFPTLLAQERNGDLVPRSDAAGRARASRLLIPQSRGFSFPAGRRRSVLGLVRRLPRGNRGLYATLVFRATPRKVDRRRSIRNIFQLNALLLLDPPGGRTAVRAGELRAEQDGPRRLRVFAAARNTGTAYGAVRGSFLIRDASRKLVARQRLAPERLLPGAVVELSAPLAARLPAGRYTAEATLRAGGRRVRTRGAVALFGLNQVATRRARVARLRAEPAYAGQDGAITAQVRNTGNVPFRPVGVVEVSAAGDRDVARVLKRVRVALDPIEPGKSAELSVNVPLPQQARGHLVTLRLLDGRHEIDVARTSIDIREPPALGARVREAILGHAMTIVGGLLALLLLAGAVVARVLWRLRSVGSSARGT